MSTSFQTEKRGQNRGTRAQYSSNAAPNFSDRKQFFFLHHHRENRVAGQCREEKANDAAGRRADTGRPEEGEDIKRVARHGVGAVLHQFGLLAPADIDGAPGPAEDAQHQQAPADVFDRLVHETARRPDGLGYEQGGDGDDKEGEQRPLAAALHGLEPGAVDGRCRHMIVTHETTKTVFYGILVAGRCGVSARRQHHDHLPTFELRLEFDLCDLIQLVAHSQQGASCRDPDGPSRGRGSAGSP